MSEVIKLTAEDERSIEEIVSGYWREEITRAVEETGEAVLWELGPRVWARLDGQEQDEFIAEALNDVIHFPGASLCRQCAERSDVGLPDDWQFEECRDQRGIYYRRTEEPSR